MDLKNTINTMVDQLNSFASEVTRVAREVGTEGKAGRPGTRKRCRWYLEGFDRLGKPDGIQLNRADPRYCKRWQPVLLKET
jgi:hypothetical protein